MERRGAGTALVGVGVGGVLGAAVGALLAAQPAAAAPENEKLGYLIEGQLLMVQQLQRLVEIGEQLIGQVPIVIEPSIVPGLVTVPLDPETLNRAIQAMRLKGKSWFPVIRMSWVCPAGVTTTFPLVLPQGIYCTRRVALLTSDFYDPTIMVNIYIDDELVTPFGISLTGPQDLDYGEYYVKKRLISLVTVNPTATDAVLSFSKTCSFMEKSFYEEFYAPIIEYMYSALERVARRPE